MNPLQIGADERLMLQNLATRAAQLPLDLEHMVDDVQTREGLARYAAYMTGQTVALPVGYLACFSVEVGHPAGPMRHLSVNAAKGELLPSGSIVWAIARELGFEGDLASCLTWIADGVEQLPMAVHLAQPIACGAPVALTWLQASDTVH